MALIGMDRCRTCGRRIGESETRHIPPFNPGMQTGKMIRWAVENTRCTDCGPVRAPEKKAPPWAMTWFRTKDLKPPRCEPVLAWWGSHCNPEVIYLSDYPGPMGGDQWFTATDDRLLDASPTHWRFIAPPEDGAEPG